MRRVLAVVVGVVAASAFAAPKTAIVAGDCADPALNTNARDFRETAAKLLGPQLMDPESVLDIVRPRPTRSMQDIERQVDSARALFYGGQPERSLELVERTLNELERASPEAKPWPATQNALVLLALIQKGLDRPKEMNDAFKRLVRLDPAFKLDPDAHPPSAIAALDAVKKDVARTRKAPLTVRVESGPAALVFVDGLPMGQTPLKLDLVPGTYRISLTAPGMVSFPHRVELPRDTKLNVDLAFEGGIGLQAPLCLVAGADDNAAIKLGQLVTAERMIVLRNTAKSGAPTVITGAVYELASGKQERFASVSPEYLSNLAIFLVTGKEQAGLFLNGAPKAEQPKAAELTPVAKVDAPPPPPPPVDATKPTFEVNTPSGPNVGRIASFTLIGVGAATVLAGVLAYTSMDADRARLVGITLPDGRFRPTSLRVGQESLELLAALDTNATLSFALIGGGAGAIVGGVVGLFLFPSAPASLSVTPTANGVSASLSGRF